MLPFHEIAVPGFDGNERMTSAGPRGAIQLQKLGKDTAQRQSVEHQMVSRHEQKMTFSPVGEQMRSKQRARREIERLAIRGGDPLIDFVR